MISVRNSRWLALLIGLVGQTTPVSRAEAQENTVLDVSPEGPITATFTNAPVRDVLFMFGDYKAT